MSEKGRLLMGVAGLAVTALLMPRCSGGGCGAVGSAGYSEPQELGVAVPPAAVSALGAYAKTQRTPINRATSPARKHRDGGVPKRRKATTGDAGVPL